MDIRLQEGSAQVRDSIASQEAPIRPQTITVATMDIKHLQGSAQVRDSIASSYNGYQASSRLSSWNRAMRDYDSGYAGYQAPSRLVNCPTR